MNTTEARAERFKTAVSNNDQEYLSEFTAGREAAFQGAEINTDNDTPQGFVDGFESGRETQESVNDSSRNKVFVQPHPLGGLEFICFGSDGSRNSARITVEAAASLQVILTMWMTTMLQQSFFETAQVAKQATESGIVIPGKR